MGVKLETRKYINDSEMMTVIKLKQDDVILDEIKIYNEKKEVEIDKDLRWTAENIDYFLVKFYNLAKETNIEFDSQSVDV